MLRLSCALCCLTRLFPTLLHDSDYNGWVNTYSNGTYCEPTAQIGNSFQATAAACKAVCEGISGCGAIYSDATGTHTSTCQLFTRAACIAPAGRNPNYPSGKIFLATGVCSVCAVANACRSRKPAENQAYPLLWQECLTDQSQSAFLVLSFGPVNPCLHHSLSHAQMLMAGQTHTPAATSASRTCSWAQPPSSTPPTARRSACPTQLAVPSTLTPTAPPWLCASCTPRARALPLLAATPTTPRAGSSLQQVSLLKASAVTLLHLITESGQGQGHLRMLRLRSTCAVRSTAVGLLAVSQAAVLFCYLKRTVAPYECCRHLHQHLH